MIPVNINAYSRESGTTLIPKLQSAILSNACFITDFTTFSPTEISLTMEGDANAALNTLKIFHDLGITFTEYSKSEIKSIVNRKGDITVEIYIVTGRKKDLGSILDDRMNK